MPPSAPENLLDDIVKHDLFRELKPVAAKSLRRFVTIEEFHSGASFIRQGEFTDSFYFILSGLVTAYRTDEGGATDILDQLGPGKWFGEVSALSNQPSLAKLVADTPCVAAVLDSGLFKELYKAGGRFQELVDEEYRRRSLTQHLKVVPLFKGLSAEHLAGLRGAAEFSRIAKGEVLAAQGDVQDRLILVRSGAVGAYRVDANGTEHTAGYLMSNSAFGDEAVLEDSAHWPSTYRTLMDTELLVIRAASMREALKNDAGAMEAIRYAARLVRMEAAGEVTGFYDDGTEVNPDELEVMIHRQSVKGGDALVINLQKCVRCNACVESCVAVHDDGVPRLSKKGHRVAAENNELGADINLATSCYSCEAPGCMMSCSYGAIRRDTAGMIRFIWDNCVGCAMCTSACPYDVIRLTPPPGEAEAQADSGVLSKLPWIGGFFRKPAAAAPAEERKGYHREAEAKGKAVKCDRCEGLPFEACVYNCPCGAIERVPPSLLFKDIFSSAGAAGSGEAQS